MKRWNGWGDESIVYPLPGSAGEFLAAQLGAGEHLEDASLEKVLSSVRPARLPAHPMLKDDPLERLLHARGQSLPDWVALRSGSIGVLPDGVVYPASDEEVCELFKYARQVGGKVIPYGGGTSVVGHINPLPGDAPVLTIDLSHLIGLIDLDEISHLAVFGAGISGPQLELALNQHGYTLGHFPQSFEYSTLGGWIATRSSGQQSYHYGRMEGLFAGGHLESPLGPLDLPVNPASAAGPDLRQLILGSEGRLGVLTRATVRISPLPEFEAFYGAFFHSWEEGAAAVRSIAQAGTGVSMMRLSNPLETITTLALAGKEQLVKLADRGLNLLHYKENRCLMIFGVTGTRQAARQVYQQASAVIHTHGGLIPGKVIGKTWARSRFYSPYLRNTLWENGYALDTVETALPWSRVMSLAEELLPAMQTCLEPVDQHAMVFAHLSHVYADGASLYVTYLWRRDRSPDETLRRWKVLKKVASGIILKHGGTISHQHGVGLDHAPYLEAEKGELGMRAIAAACETLDPDGMMNPGKLINVRSGL